MPTQQRKYAYADKLDSLFSWPLNLNFTSFFLFFKEGGEGIQIYSYSQ